MIHSIDKQHTSWSGWRQLYSTHVIHPDRPISSNPSGRVKPWLSSLHCRHTLNMVYNCEFDTNKLTVQSSIIKRINIQICSTLLFANTPGLQSESANTHFLGLPGFHNTAHDQSLWGPRFTVFIHAIKLCPPWSNLRSMVWFWPTPQMDSRFSRITLPRLEKQSIIAVQYLFIDVSMYIYPSMSIYVNLAVNQCIYYPPMFHNYPIYCIYPPYPMKSISPWLPYLSLHNRSGPPGLLMWKGTGVVQ